MEYSYVLNGDSFPEDAIAFVTTWENDQASYIAEDAGEHCYDSEPDPESFPIEIEIFANDVSLGTFEIQLEFEPTFHAGEI